MTYPTPDPAVGLSIEPSRIEVSIAADQPAHVGYNAAVSGLNLNFNRAYFEWKRVDGTWRTTVDARGERFLPGVDMVRVDVAQRDVPLFTYAPGRVEEWTVASAALGKGGSRWLPVRDPGKHQDLAAGTDPIGHIPSPSRVAAGKEEDLLFEAMVDCGVPREYGPIACMLGEHEAGRARRKLRRALDGSCALRAS